MYLLLPHLLDEPTAIRAAQTLQALPESDWQDGRESAGPQARGVKNNRQLAHEHPTAAAVRQAVLQALDRSPPFLSAALPLKIVTPRINRYDPAHPAYGWHVDNAVRQRPDGAQVRTDLSCTVLLSGPGSYDGGELEIQDADAQHRIKPVAGEAVLYPSGMLHQVRPVTRGVRLACFFWVQSLVPNDAQRRLLHMLDMNLLALREQHGESAQTTALMGVYHNLLRQWVQS